MRPLFYNGDMEKTKNSVLSCALISLALPLLYLLSTGPIVYYYEKTQSEPGPAVEAFYRPIEWAWHQPALRKALEAYLEPWRKLAR